MISLEAREACLEGDVTKICQVISSLSREADKEQAFDYVFQAYQLKGEDIPAAIYYLLVETWLNQGKKDQARRLMAKCQGMTEDYGKRYFRYFLQAEEEKYRENFTRNLQVLQEWGVLFTDREMDYERAKYQVADFVDDESPITLEKADNPPGSRTYLLMVDYNKFSQLEQMLKLEYSLYLVFEDETFLNALLLLADFTALLPYLQQQHIIFFLEEETLITNFFLNPIVILPMYVLETRVKYHTLLEQWQTRRKEKAVANLAEIRKMCAEKNEGYYRKLFTQSPENIKILLSNTVYTQVNQHVCRSWQRALQILGYRAELLIEQKGYEFNANLWPLVEKIAVFQPDIVFHINFLSGDIIPDAEICQKLLWVMRNRDLHPAIRTGIPYTHNNFIWPVIEQWVDEWQEAGVPKERLFFYPDGVDFHNFIVSEKEAYDRRWEADVVLVSNCNIIDFDKNYLVPWSRSLPQSSQQDFLTTVSDFIEEFKAAIREERVDFCESDCQKLLADRLTAAGLEIQKNILTLMSHTIIVYMIQFMRQQELAWIIRAGITDKIRIWGRGWENFPEFRPYWVGVAAPGQELAGIYRHSKIALSNNPLYSLHERLFEILASGGFPLVRLSKNCGEDRGRDLYFQPGETIAQYRNKEELVQLICKYLQDPAERERISANGREVLEEHFTNIAVARKGMAFLANYFALEHTIH